MKKAEVIVKNNLPRLVIDGQAEAPIIFFLRAEIHDAEELNRLQVAECAKTGVHLYSTIVPYPLLKTGERRDMTEVIYAMRVIIDSDPEAKILLRVNLPMFGEEAERFNEMYPGTLMEWRVEREPDSTSVVSGNPLATSVASDEWYAVAEEAFEELVRSIEADEELNSHVLGYHIGCGETCEWFLFGLRERGLDYSPANRKKYQEYLKNKYGDIRKLEEAWNIADGSYESFEQIAVPEDLPYQDREKKAERTLYMQPGDQRYMDYYDYSSELMSDRMLSISAFARKLVGRDKLLVFFYGYYFELFDALTGHFRLQKVLKSPNIDAFTSPVSYGDRNHGGVGALMSPVDSVTANGKLWIVENDIRSSHIIRQRAKEAGSDWVPMINSIWNQREVYTREIAQMLSHNLGCWYMDLGACGWYHHPIIWDHITKIYNLYRNIQEDLKPFAPEVAVVVDEYAMSLAAHALAVGMKLLYRMREEFYRAGVKFGFYTSKDYEEGKVQGAKAVFYLNPFDISAERAEKIIRQVKQDGATLILMHGTGRTDAETVKKLTGMDIRATDCGMQDLTATVLSGALKKDVVFVPQFTAPGAMGKDRISGPQKYEQSANPAYYVEQNRNVQPLAVYEKDALAGRIAAARCVHDGFKSIFAGTLCLSIEAIRELCRLSGAHVYSETNDTFISGNGMYLIHTSAEEGVRTVRLPKKERLVCWPSGEVVEADELTTDGRSTASYFWLNADMYPEI